MWLSWLSLPVSDRDTEGFRWRPPPAAHGPGGPGQPSELLTPPGDGGGRRRARPGTHSARRGSVSVSCPVRGEEIFSGTATLSAPATADGGGHPRAFEEERVLPACSPGVMLRGRTARRGRGQGCGARRLGLSVGTGSVRGRVVAGSPPASTGRVASGCKLSCCDAKRRLEIGHLP